MSELLIPLHDHNLHVIFNVCIDASGEYAANLEQFTRAVNRLHNLLARVFSELATLTDDIEGGWVLRLL